jgi:hypothetical protein
MVGVVLRAVLGVPKLPFLNLYPSCIFLRLWFGVHFCEDIPTQQEVVLQNYVEENSFLSKDIFRWNRFEEIVFSSCPDIIIFYFENCVSFNSSLLNVSSSFILSTQM